MPKRELTVGKAVQRGSRTACLCNDGRTYSRKCCKGNLINQGIGSISKNTTE